MKICLVFLFNSFRWFLVNYTFHKIYLLVNTLETEFDRASWQVPANIYKKDNSYWC